MSHFSPPSKLLSKDSRVLVFVLKCIQFLEDKISGNQTFSLTMKGINITRASIHIKNAKIKLDNSVLDIKTTLLVQTNVKSQRGISSSTFPLDVERTNTSHKNKYKETISQLYNSLRKYPYASDVIIQDHAYRFFTLK